MTEPTMPAPEREPDAPRERPLERPREHEREEGPPPPAERPIPRGCHPLVFGVVMGTIQFALTLYFVGRC